ncbi:MAG: Eco57I restriction-modification methylase domain-containing protein [Serratia fonticola]
MNSYTLAQKKELGAYYTPPVLTNILSNWAIQSQDDLILEPSFGGCGFLDSCFERLQFLGASKPVKNLFGVDIDKQAFDFLSEKFNLLSLDGKFILDDFINVSPVSFSAEKFDVIIGNPPYISMHNMTLEQRESCTKILKESKFNHATLGRNASLWAFFLLHSLSFLRENGRVAWVLPSSLLNAYYAKSLLDIYRKHFSSIKLIKINERLFKNEGADEVSVILACEHFSQTEVIKSNYSFFFADTVSSVSTFLECEHSKSGVISDNYKLGLLNSKSLDTYYRITKRQESLRFSDAIDLKIGMVTGLNGFFIFNEEERVKNNLDESYLIPVVSKFSDLIGIRHNKSRHGHLLGKNRRVYLLNPSKADVVIKNTALRSYLSKVKHRERIKNRTFRKREDWFRPDDGLYPDAFMTYMVHEGPRLVLNQGRINCTNSIHRVYFKNKLGVKEKLAYCLSILSTYSQLSAELEGRSYGSGVLKIEPTGARNIKLLMNDRCIELLCERERDIESFLKIKKINEATKIVDAIFIACGFLTNAENMHLSAGLSKLRMDRYKGVRNHVNQ